MPNASLFRSAGDWFGACRANGAACRQLGLGEGTALKDGMHARTHARTRADMHTHIHRCAVQDACPTSSSRRYEAPDTAVAVAGPFLASPVLPSCCTTYTSNRCHGRRRQQGRPAAWPTTCVAQKNKNKGKTSMGMPHEFTRGTALGTSNTAALACPCLPHSRAGMQRPAHRTRAQVC